MPKGHGSGRHSGGSDKHDKKDRGRRRGCTDVATHSSDEENETIDTISATSSLSDHQSVHVDDDNETDETSVQEDFEDKVKASIDGTSQKSAKGRLECLHSLRVALTKKYMCEFVADRKVTLADCLERCLKKGKGEEQCEAALCVVLLLVQLSSPDDREQVYTALRPTLKLILTDTAACCKARSCCAEALGVCAFIASDGPEDTADVMSCLENVYKCSYHKGDGSTPTHTADVSSLHTSALDAWTLLLSVTHNGVIQHMADTHLGKLSELLTSVDVELRITAGEAIALLYELARDQNEEFDNDGYPALCTQLKQMSTECCKYRAKKDRRQQRSSFRDILRAVENADFPTERIKVDACHSVTIDRWLTKTRYDALCRVLGSGMNLHLQENYLLRDIFDLGPPVPIGAQPTSRANKFERHMIHDAAFKARTKSRSKLRDRKTGSTAVE